MGHARCNAVAPQAFDLDDEGYAIVTPYAAEASPADLHSAAESCPEQAITVEP
jgi:ferredoxin